MLGVFAEFATPLDALDRSSADIWIVAQALRDPGNLGTILRTGDAVGAGGLILVDDCVDPFSVEAVRASMGALFTQKLAAMRGMASVMMVLSSDPMKFALATTTAARRGLKGPLLIASV